VFECHNTCCVNVNMILIGLNSSTLLIDGVYLHICIDSFL
jgi:hypothetical protein